MIESPTTFFKRQTAGLPSYWKIATIRCSIYALIVGSSSFDTGIEGYNSFSDMTQFQFYQLWEHVGVAMATVWVAFLDQTLTNLGSRKSGLTAADLQTQPISAPKAAGISPVSAGAVGQGAGNKTTDM